MMFPLKVPTAELCVFEEIPVGWYDVSPGVQVTGISLKDCLTRCFNDQSCAIVLYRDEVNGQKVSRSCYHLKESTSHASFLNAFISIDS
ncbi:unnamed protein product [Nippostrongylus brasiliensis]|uniref:Apple domain-containing protein n=1 Tax=Nippostrongylus brasiliensis TaxID=27835 RepID=A0A0N4YRN0_NIPBR|nr:unnamed protein product [Nippostrongylus brasiliensis]